MHPTAFLELALKTLQDNGNALPAFWSAFSQSAAALALTAAWQGAVVALGLALCLRLAPRSPARHRFTLWAAGFGVIVGLQVLPLIEHYLIQPFFGHLQVMPVSAASLAAAASHPGFQLHLNPAWGLAIALLWVAASVYRAADLALHSFRLRKLWKTAVPLEIDSASLPRSLGRLSRRTIQVCTTGELERPSVIGFLAPRILIPDWLFSRLTPGELDQIVLHETEHLRRRDDWTNLLQKLCLVLFPLNPGLAWIERRLCREREMACDDGVIGITRAPRAYAACLTSLAERGLQRRSGALSLGAWHGRPELVRRVQRILSHKHVLSPVAARAVVAALGCALLAGGVALGRCPRLVAFVPAPSIPAVPRALLSASSRGSASASFPAASLPIRRVRAHSVEVAAAKLPSSHLHRAVKRASAANADERAVYPAELASFYSQEGGLYAEPGAALASDKSDVIVMTTWQNLEYPASPVSKSGRRDYGAVNAFAVQRLPRKITVTRMYLEIYCGAGTRQAAWLAIQL